MNALSRVEQMQLWWVDAVAAIQQGTTDDYRSNVQEVFTVRKDIEKLTLFPSVSVLVGPTRILFTDSRGEAFNVEAQMIILGYVRHDQADALLHDLTRVVTSNILTNLNDAVNPWHVMVGRQPMIQCDWDWMEGTDMGWVGLTFDVQVQNVGQPL